MAALQTIRNHGALIVGAIGLGLFGFIAGDLFNAIETTAAFNKQQAGEVYGTSIDIMEYQNLVEEMTQVMKMQRTMQGQSENLTDAELQQVREYVWNDFVRSQVIAKQAEEAGIQVTTADFQNALVKGEARSLSMMAAILGSKDGKLDFAALQEFLKNKEKNVAMATQAQDGSLEAILAIDAVWKWTEKQLRKELLETKFYTLINNCCIGNPVSAQLDAATADQKRTVVAAFPFNAIADADVTVEDADMQEIYNAKKDFYKLYSQTRDVKVLDVEVKASTEDQVALTMEVNEVANALRAGNDPATTVAASKSIVAFNNVPVRKDAYRGMNDIYSRLDTATVGYVSPAFYTVADNTVNTYKLVSKATLPDSVLYRRIFAVAADLEASKTLADSIATAVKGGADFAELAKKYQQPTDSMWLTSAQYEGATLDANTAEMINLLNATKAGQVAVLKLNNNYSLVLQVLETKNPVEKYNLAVVKCKNDFSKETYNNELSKLNKFLSENTTIENIEKNALAAGYMVSERIVSAPDNSLEAEMSGAKEAVRWALDDAKVGDISRIYECGANKEHLLVMAVAGINDGEYVAWDNKNVKPELERIAMQNKKAAKALELVGTPKTMDEVAKVQQVVVDTISANFARNARVNYVGIAEPALSGAIARAKAGEFVGPIKGAGAVYYVQVLEELPSAVPYNEANALQQATQNFMSNIMRYQYYGQPQEVLLNTLMLDADVVDSRYKF
ncbi:MAG: peptidylprolyl isomerase [Prevotellamassilia sp.]|nr:peptidylprolyl isomerase [Prevotellamassilia sp.]